MVTLFFSSKYEYAFCTQFNSEYTAVRLIYIYKFFPIQYSL